MKCRPIIAILRGIRPIEAESVSEILIDAGIKIIEVPLNSPSPIETLTRMVNFHGDKAIFGAGTVLKLNQVREVYQTGAKLIISPNTNIEVIKKTKEFNMLSIPGCYTATEALMSLEHGADGIKLFPAFLIGEIGFQALSAVLPNNVMSFAVGGIDTRDFKSWMSVNITGFGLGSSLYKPGLELLKIRKKTEEVIKVFDKVSHNKLINI